MTIIYSDKFVYFHGRVGGTCTSDSDKPTAYCNGVLPLDFPLGQTWDISEAGHGRVSMNSNNFDELYIYASGGHMFLKAAWNFARPWSNTPYTYIIPGFLTII